MTKLEDILEYIEAQAATIPLLVGKIKVVLPEQPIPAFKDYGLRVYFGEDGWKEIKRNKIGPIVSEIYKINVDLVFNRALTPREIYSDSRGLSYWDNILMSTFVNKNNGGVFKDSYWSPLNKMESDADATILKGQLLVHVQNIYT